MGSLKRFQIAGFFLKGNISPLISIGAPQQSKIQTGGMAIEQIILPVQFNQTDHIFCRTGIKLTPFQSRIYKGMESDTTDGGAMCGNIPEHNGDYTLRQIIGFNFIFHNQTLDARRGIKMSADNPVQHFFVTNMI